MEHDFVYFEKYVYKRLAIDLSAYKSKQLHRRILSIMNRSGYKDLKEYLEAISNDNIQRNQFLDYITINVSEFFRNKSMFDDLEVRINKDLLNKFPRLKIWSTACSIGAEPYSLAIILHKISERSKYSILATDIDNNILERAKLGIYKANEVRNVSDEDKKAYFEEKDGRFHISKDIKRSITFKKHDLILDDYKEKFHLITCRNVVIYFNKDIKKKLYQRFYDSLMPGGLLFVGATETIFNYRELGFEKVSTFLYQKKK